MSNAAIRYADDLEYLEDILSLVSLRLYREVLVTRALRGDGRQESFLGLFLSDQEVDQLLAELNGAARANRSEAPELDAGIRALKDRIVARVRLTGRPLPPQMLAAIFGLTNPEVDLLLYLLAAEIDDRFGRVYGYLHDDVGRKRLSPGLAYRLMQDSFRSIAEFRALLHPSAPLVRERLVLFLDEGLESQRPLMERAMRMEDRVVDYLLGGGQVDRALNGRVELSVGEEEPDYRNAVDTIRAELKAQTRPVVLTGDSDADPEIWVATLADSLGLPVLTMDWTWTRELERSRLGTVMAKAAREARLQEAILHIRNLDECDDSQLFTLCHELSGLVCLSARRERAWKDYGLDALEVRVAPLGHGARTRRWAAELRGRARGLDVDQCDELAPSLAQRYPFTSRDMRAAVRTTPFLSASTDPVRIDSALVDTCKRIASLQMGRAAQKVTTDFHFDDLILPAGTLTLLKELILQHDYAHTVLDDWGLRQRFHQAEGSTALFMGPSGTGKTMAASVIGNELGLELFRIDLSGVVSKYIGETEKNLDRVFDAASRSRVVLFIDEADALFGKRSEVKDAHDRYANIEISFLLQRMEAYAGIAILATNLGQNIDEAFFRRIQSVIEFPMPQESDRLRLWERLTASDAPLEDDVDLQFLAARFELSGGHIKNCIIMAALYAAGRRQVIGMEHLMRAVGREYVKIGRPISRATFGSYYPAIRKSGMVN